MLGKAMTLCEAAFGMLWSYDGDCFRMLAHHGLPVALQTFMQRPQRSPPEGSGLRRLLDGEALVQHVDIAAEPLPTTRGNRAALVELGGARTSLEVALRKDDELLGWFHVYRREVRPFTDKQIALLRNFAAQAVIAMENARLITETQEALEQQTATAEILGVINSSPGDLTPVFDAILKRRIRSAGLNTERWRRLTASTFGQSLYVRCRNLSASYYVSRFERPLPGPPSAACCKANA